MAYSYIYNVKYEISRCDVNEKWDEDDWYHMFYAHNPMSSSEYKALKKTNKDLLQQALKNLTTDFMFGGENMSPKEYKKHLSHCLFEGAVKAKIKYNLGGYARCTFTFNHELSEEEEKELDRAVEAQMIDGYGEEAFFLFENEGYKYYLGI